MYNFYVSVIKNFFYMKKNTYRKQVLRNMSVQLKRKSRLGMVVHTFNLSTQEAEAGGSQVGGQSGLHSKTLSQKTNKQTKKSKHMGNKLL
jgi:hypothetical protein